MEAHITILTNALGNNKNRRRQEEKVRPVECEGIFPDRFNR